MSHSKNTMLCLSNVAWGYQHRQAQHFTSVFWKNDAVIPKPCSWEVATWLSFIAINNLLFNFFLILNSQLFSFFFQLSRFNLSQYTCSLLTSHNCNFSIWPHVKHSWVICAATHAIVSCTVWSSNDTSYFRDSCSWDSIDHLCTMLGNTFMFVFLSNHKSCNILQEKKWNFTLWAYLHKVGSFLSTLTKENTIVGNYSHCLVV